MNCSFCGGDEAHRFKMFTARFHFPATGKEGTVICDECVQTLHVATVDAFRAVRKAERHVDKEG